MRMRPGRIKVHIDNQGASKPDPHRGQERPNFFKPVARQPESDPQPRKAVQCRRKRHGVHVRPRKSVRRNMPAHKIISQHTQMSGNDERRPQNSRANCEMIIQMAGGRILPRAYASFAICFSLHEGWIRVQPIRFEMKVPLNYGRAHVGIVASTVAPNPRVHQRKRQNKERQQYLLVTGKMAQSRPPAGHRPL